MYIWASNSTDNWSGYAPDFKELEENEVYIEREDEFDIIEETAEMDKAHEEDFDVDIETVDHIASYSSDSEPDDEIPYFIPTLPQPYNLVNRLLL